MTPQEKYEKETGKKAHFIVHDVHEKRPTWDYVYWLESKTDVQQAMNDLLTVAKNKIRNVNFISCFSSETVGSFHIATIWDGDKGVYGGPRFDTWADIVKHVDDMPARNELLFKKF